VVVYTNFKNPSCSRQLNTVSPVGWNKEHFFTTKNKEL